MNHNLIDMIEECCYTHYSDLKRMRNLHVPTSIGNFIES